MELLLVLLMKISNKRAASLVMQLFARFPLQTFGFNPKAVLWIFWGQNCYGAVFLPVLQFFPVTIIPPMLYKHTSFIYHPQYIILATDVCKHPLRHWISKFWLLKEAARRLPKLASEMLLEEHPCVFVMVQQLFRIKTTHTILRELSTGLRKISVSSYLLHADIVCVHKSTARDTEEVLMCMGH